MAKAASKGPSKPPRASGRVWILAGLEPLGRAGLLADVATVAATGGQPVGLATALTAQAEHVFAVEPVSAAMLAQQLDGARREAAPAAVKLGIVPSRALLKLIEAQVPRDVPWIVDPVVRSSRGGALSQLRASDYLRLAAPNVILTPNVPELAWLVGQDGPLAGPAVHEAMTAVLSAGFGGVLLKGGHARGHADDLLLTRDGLRLFKGKRLKLAGVFRGTGCRFASALASGLAQGLALEVAAEHAKAFVRGYLTGA